MKMVLLLLPCLLFGNAIAQTYKTTSIVRGEVGDYHTIKGNGWLDYNQKEKYIELIFNDSLYRYKILKTGKPINDKRFIIHFKGTRDSMLWNVENDGEFFFALVMNGEHYWFRELSNCDSSEITAAKSSLSSR